MFQRLREPMSLQVMAERILDLSACQPSDVMYNCSVFPYSSPRTLLNRIRIVDVE